MSAAAVPPIIADAVTIRLSAGKVALIDLEDLERVSTRKWTAHWNKYTWYGVSRRGGVNLYLHRFIKNAPDDLQVDHEDLNGLNCRKVNLRLANESQQGANRRKQAAPASSQYKGVDQHHKGWRARIRKDKLQRTIGHFATEIEAALAYDAAARELHGEFARCNFPLEACPQ